MNPRERQDVIPLSPDAERRLGEALTERFGGEVEVPGAVDEAVLAAARQRMGQAAEPVGVAGRIGRATGWAAGAAAAAVMLGLLIWPALSPAKHYAMGDVDANGRIDIADAFAVARSVRDGETDALRRADANGDGRIDATDVEQIAASAVALTPHPSGGTRG